VPDSASLSGRGATSGTRRIRKRGLGLPGHGSRGRDYVGDALTPGRAANRSPNPGGTTMGKIFDADSHVMEVEDWLPSFADPDVREQLRPLGLEKAGKGAAELMASLPGLWESHKDQDIDASVISGPKGWLAPGALDTDVRSKVLDALEIDAQLVFPTFSLGHFAASKDTDVLYGGTRAMNRAMTAFCADDPRLLPVGYLPLRDPARAATELDAALEAGVKAVWVPSEAPGDFSPAHVDLDPVWARLAEANV